MRYRVVVMGRSGKGAFAPATARYLERLGHLAGDADLLELKESAARTTRRRREDDSAALLAAVRGRSVALDERGRTWTTSELAAHVSTLESSGTSSMTLLVGGAEGMTQQLRDEVDEVWSLSSLTLPHELALVVLLEQLYRVETIRAGHPYHRA